MNDRHEIIVLGGGCFWCVEAVFKMCKGVESVLPGYAGGHTKNPTYDEVCNGNTGHAEVVQVTYNPMIISTKDILTIFFASHDPTTKNRQGADIGTQYRSAVYYTSEVQKAIVEEIIEAINSSHELGAPIVTEIKPLDVFYKAESYHHDYFSRNKDVPYCELVINPKLEKVQKEFAMVLKKQ